MNKTEERKYEQLRKLGQELHIPIPEHSLELEVFDKDGNRIQHHKQRSHSWVRNAYNMLITQLASKNMDDGTFGPGLLSIKRTSGAISSGSYGVYVGSSGSDSAVSVEITSSGFRAAAAIATRGILVGSGVAAESFEDFVLQTPISEGIGAGQLNYVAMEVPSKSYAALTQTITWIRYMNNNSLGNVDVNEVSLGTQGSVAGTGLFFIVSRDVLGATVTIPATGQLKVTYTIQLTYPS